LKALDSQPVGHRLPMAMLLPGQLLQIDGRRLQPRVIQESLGLVDVAACGVVELSPQVSQAVEGDGLGIDASLDCVALQRLSGRLAGERLVPFRFRRAVVVAQVLASVRGRREDRFVADQLPAGDVQMVLNRLLDWRARWVPRLLGHDASLRAEGRQSRDGCPRPGGRSPYNNKEGAIRRSGGHPL
jgi:hypothetical protein